MRRRDFLATTLALACHRKAPKEVLPATRIVSVSPSTTEAVCAVGARAALVGRSRYCDFPPDVASLPEVGGYVDANLEAIVALAPDLVTGARGPAGGNLTFDLERRGIATFFPPTESFAEIDAMIAGLGERTSHAQDAALVVEKIHADLAALDAKLAGRAAPRVLFVFGISPIVVAGPATFASEMLTRAHAQNAVTEGSGYPTLGMERVAALDPDFIVEAAFGENGKQAITPDAAGWGALKALKNGRIAHLSDETILRPGPRIAQGAHRSEEHTSELQSPAMISSSWVQLN